MIEKAFNELFPNKRFDFVAKIKYSDAFNNYNANIRMQGNLLELRMSKQWKEVSEEIKIGLVQTLLLKLFKEKSNTINIDLYNNFIKALPKYSIPTNVNPALKESFERVNINYFNGYLDLPNLVWGNDSFTRLGTYEYASDTVTISGILKEQQELLDYIMYHELIHKKLKFSHKNGRNYSHTRKFKELEKAFNDAEIEKKLNSFLKKSRARGFWKFW